MDRITESIKKIFQFLYRYKFTLLFIIFIYIISVYPIGMALRLSIFSSCATFFLILNILAKSKLRWIFNILLIVIVTFNGYVSFVYSTWVTIGILSSVLETNISEAATVLGGGVILIIILITVSAVLIYLSEKELKSFELSRKMSCVILLIYCVLFFPTMIWRKMDIEKLNLQMAENIVMTYAPFFYTNILTTILYIQETQKIKKFINADKNIPDGIELIVREDKPRKIFLIIGESASKQHMSVYGYSIKTTPFMDSLYVASPPKIGLYNAIAPSSLTITSVPIIITFASPVNQEPVWDKKSLISMAKIAGYETLWVSNQLRSDAALGMIGYIASESDYEYFSKTEYSVKSDLTLIPVIKEKYEEEKYQFFIIHLTGSHYHYKDRYDNIDKQAIKDGYASSRIVEYDRSIHHTDRVVREIYNIAQQGESFIICYLSDHGEIVELEQHGPWLKGPEQLYIPLVMMGNNPAYSDSIISKYYDPEMEQMNISSCIYVFLEMMGYSIPDHYVDKAIDDGRYIYYPGENPRLFLDVKKEIP